MVMNSHIEICLKSTIILAGMTLPVNRIFERNEDFAMCVCMYLHKKEPQINSLLYIRRLRPENLGKFCKSELSSDFFLSVFVF